MFGYCLIHLLADIFNRFETIEMGDIKLTVKSINKANLNELTNIAKSEEERKQKEAWFNQKTNMEIDLRTKLAWTRVWKRSSPESYLTDTQESGAAKGANSYNELLIRYINFCKSIGEKPNSDLKYITDIRNKGEDFMYGEEPKFFME